MGIEETAKKYNSNDLEAEFEILDDFARFDQKNESGLPKPFGKGKEPERLTL